MNCPVCLIKFDNGLKVSEYVQCPNCFCFIKEKMPNADDLKNKLHNMMLKACFDKSKEKERLEKADYQLDLIEILLEPGSVYDIGTAGGFFLKRAKERGWKVFGNEISKKAIEWALTNYEIDIDYGYFEDIGLKDNFFDAVVLWNSLEHVFNPDRVIQKCRDILKDSGIVQIEVPLKNITEIEKYLEPLHLIEFDEYGLDLLMKNKGFKLVDKHCFTEKDRRYIDTIYRKI